MAQTKQGPAKPVFKKLKPAYGFDDVAIVPGGQTMDPKDVDISLKIGGHSWPIPILASAMDGVVDVNMAIAYGKMGGMAVLNLHGVQTRYESPSKFLDEIAKADKENATKVLQKIYATPIKPELIERRIHEIKAAGVIPAVSSTPADAMAFGKIAEKAGAGVFVVQSTVTALKHVSKTGTSMDLKTLIKSLNIPVVVGNMVGYEIALKLMATGVDALLVGIGPGAACTTRGVVGVGVPQITATIEVAAARDVFQKKNKRRVAVIVDGGMRTGGDICKALAAGGDGVMIGSPFARCKEAPGRGYHWGMATPHASLPRGARVHAGVSTSLEQLIFGPAHTDSGSENFAGAIREALGLTGSKNIAAFQDVEMVLAPSFRHEGKMLQTSQGVGMFR